MGLKIKIPILLLFLFTFLETGYASWTGPVELLSGTWGSNPGQFGIKYGDTGDSFPNAICISSGNIVIADENNSRVQTFKPEGSRIAAFGPQNIPESEGWKLGWPLRLGCLSNSVYTEFDKYTQIYSMTGSLIKSWDNLQGGLSVILQDDNFVTETSTAFYFYSPTGQLIKTSTTRPLELGQVKLEKRSQTRYKITLTYPDKVYGLSSDREFVKYVRTSNDKVYGVNPGGAWRFNQCGKLEGFLLMPEGQQDEIPGQGPEEPQVYVHSEYGEPVVAPNGDIYTWNYTPDAYKILKWTWVDDPNVPTGPDAPGGLAVTPSINGLYLTWTASPNDPGCVTGYEIARATTSGGVFSTVGTVEKGVVKYNDTTATAGTTYYYKVRAVAGTEFSPYTAEASGKR